MPVTIKSKNGIVTAYLKGDIDHHTAPGMRDAVDDAISNIESAKTVVLDFSEVSFMDSSGVGLVMGRYRLCVQCHKKLRVDNLGERDYKILKMSGIEKIAEINKKKGNEK